MNAVRLAQRPYFLRAYYAWLTDSGLTPHLIVNTGAAGVEVPAGFAQADRLVLNLSGQATEGLELGNDAIECQARFGTVAHWVRIPIAAVLGLYARETGEGLAFAGDESSPPAVPPAEGEQKGRPQLKVVK